MSREAVDEYFTAEGEATIFGREPNAVREWKKRKWEASRGEYLVLQ